MKMASANDTWDLIKSLFGEAHAEKINLAAPDERGSIETISRVSQFDLMEQIEGEFHAFYQGRLIRGNTQYMIPKKEINFYMRINRFIRMNYSVEYVRRQLEIQKIRESLDTQTYDAAWKENIINKLKKKGMYPIFVIDPDTIPEE